MPVLRIRRKGHHGQYTGTCDLQSGYTVRRGYCCDSLDLEAEGFLFITKGGDGDADDGHQIPNGMSIL